MGYAPLPGIKGNNVLNLCTTSKDNPLPLPVELGSMSMMIDIEGMI